MALVNKNFEDLFEFSRASEATYWDSNGVLQIAGVDEPRFDHDILTGEPKGILIEGSATNTVPHETVSGFFTVTDASNSFWGDAGDYLIPGGERFYQLVNNDASSSFYRYRNTAAYYPGEDTDTITMSIFVKKGTAVNSKYFGFFTLGDARARFDLEEGTVVTEFGPDTKARIQRISEDTFRCSITAPKGDFTRVCLVLFQDAPDTWIGDASSSYGQYHWLGGFQIELGEYPTSYIPTSGSPVTRAEDLINIPISGV